MNEESEELELPESGVLVDDYKDLAIEMLSGSREKTLWWENEYD